MGTREIFTEFEQLLDKSQKCFNKLRELSPYGNSRWEHHFHKAFQIYSRLWKFQQDHREVLTSRGMERWEVGDIASKIGQLYYNYYLRTSEVRYLHESYVFYEAIRSRSYFAQSATDASLAVKQLRYFARFVIVCLLLGRREEVWQLLQELQALTSSYTLKYKPPDAAEWRAVIAEVTGFLGADVGMPAPRTPGAALPFRASLRCGLGAPEVKVAAHRPLLLHAVLASYYPRQVKIAELPLDSFRMLQALEWEDAYCGAAPPAGEHPMLPSAAATPHAGKGAAGKGAAPPQAAANGRGGKAAPAAPPPADNTSSSSGSVAGGIGSTNGGPSRYENPSKHLMYRPTAMQLLSILTTTMEVLPRDGVLLLHLSGGGRGDLKSGGAFSSASNLCGEISPHGGDGGSHPDSMSDISGGAASVASLAVASGAGEGGINLGAAKAQGSPDGVLLPEDLLHLTRRTLLLVVDADGAFNFARLQGQEVSRTAFCLMSPSVRPHELGDPTRSGNLLTNFLSAPLTAFCQVAGNTDPSVQQLVDLQSTLSQVMGEWAALMLRAFQSPSSPRAPWSVIFRDALMRRLVLRYILCRSALGLHAAVGAKAAHLPRCFPDLPREVAPDAPEIAGGVARLAACLGRTGVFGRQALSVGSGSPMSVSR